MDNVFIFNHPLIQHKLSIMRDKNTNSKEFRELVSEVAMLMAYEVTRDIQNRDVIVLDPMLATGGSAVAAIDALKARGIHNLKFNCIISAPEGIKVLHEAHPDVPIFCGARDEKLNEHAYIVPGLGDAGDRLFGTK